MEQPPPFPSATRTSSSLLLFKAEQSLSSTLRAAHAAKLGQGGKLNGATLGRNETSPKLGKDTGIRVKSELQHGSERAPASPGKTGRSPDALSSQTASGKMGCPEEYAEGDAVAEVRALSSLQVNKVTSGGSESTRKMAGVQAMLERKRVSHEETWAGYGTAKQR
jgi:hypothetical protein